VGQVKKKNVTTSEEIKKWRGRHLVGFEVAVAETEYVV
jgi:hypothetical protein